MDEQAQCEEEEEVNSEACDTHNRTVRQNCKYDPQCRWKSGKLLPSHRESDPLPEYDMRCKCDAGYTDFIAETNNKMQVNTRLRWECSTPGNVAEWVGK